MTTLPEHKHASEMTDTEFAEANRRMAWRSPAPPPPRTHLSDDELALIRERVDSMSDADFREACLTRQWNDPLSVLTPARTASA